MLSYVLLRLLKSIPVVLLASFVVFLLLKLVPGDAAAIRAGLDATPEQVEIVRQQLGLDGTIIEQFLRWLWLAIGGDFGQSFVTRAPVSELIIDRLPATLELAILSILVVALIGIPTGIIAATRVRTPTDLAITTTSAILIGVPDYWLATLGIIIFSVWLGVLPPGGHVSLLADPLAALRHLALPVLALSARPTAVLSRFARASVLDIARSDFVWTARAKGVSERMVIIRHIAPNAMIPIMTVLAVQFGHLLGSTVVIEAIFGWPGLGGLLVSSIRVRDYTSVQAVMLILVIAFIVINLAADILYTKLDPRIRLGVAR
jgi:peptide/nickel transport system permease protein